MALIQYLTTIDVEPGALRRLPDAIAEAGIARPLIVTDAGILRAGLLERLLATLPAGLPRTVWAETPANPTEEAVDAATACLHEHGCDGVVAIGGGSSLDLAKAVALRATHDGPLAGYALIEGGMARITAAALPTIAVPTTAGTGSEVGRGALIVLRDGRKLVLTSPHLLPRRALCDPELTVAMPAALTAGTGMDALTHCIETFVSPKVNPTADAIALDGAVRAWRHLERAVQSPDDLDARWQMMIASIHGGLAFQKGLGAVHALSHPLGALAEPSLHHGTVNAVLLPAVLRFNAGHAAPKLEALRAAFGLPAGTSIDTAIAALNRRLGIPTSLHAMGVHASVRERIVAGAMIDHSVPTNPRPLTERTLADLFDEALG